jgi:SAM-dependent methyltransferase
MTVKERWREAQAAETEYWTGLSEPTVKQIFKANESSANILRAWSTEIPSPALEIGVGGLGIGLLGFLPSIADRMGIDPLPQVLPDCPQQVLAEILSRRSSLRFARASGEALPFPAGQFALVVCFNVLDHVDDAPQVLREVIRVLRPGGIFFLGVDTFSYLGLAKWHLLTKHLHANEILVRAHPYRFLPHHVAGLGKSAGFELLRFANRSFVEQWTGHSRLTHFLFRKPLEAA